MRQRASSPFRIRASLTAYGFVGLALLLWGFFVLRPTIEVFFLSLYRWDGIAPIRTWVGLDNFAKLAADPIFWKALGNNLAWLAMVVTFNVSLGLVTAALLAQKIRGRLFFQAGYFLPVVQAGIVVALTWRWIYNPDGLLNESLDLVGLSDFTRGWLGDRSLALPALALATGWAGFGLAVVIFLAGMQGIDRELYDAAAMDGANGRQAFRHVTVPGLRNVFTVVLLLEVIGAFQAFDVIWGTTQGGPLHATEVLATYMFKKGIAEGQYGYGSAIAVVFMVIVLVVAVISIAVRERGEPADG